MNSKRVFFAMIAVLVLLTAGIIGGAYAGSQMLGAKAKTLSNLKLQNKVLSQEQISLIKAKKDVAKYQPLEAIAKTIVPQDKDQAEAVREINNIASLSGIDKLSSITLPASNLGVPAPASPSSSSHASGSTSASTPVGKANLTQLTPVKGISGLYVLQITVAQDAQSAVPYSKFIDFLSRLEQNRRTSQVSSISLQPFPQDHSLVSFTLTIDEYIKP